MTYAHATYVMGKRALYVGLMLLTIVYACINIMLLHYVPIITALLALIAMCSCVLVYLLYEAIKTKVKSVQVYKCAIFAPKVCCICPLILDRIQLVDTKL